MTNAEASEFSLRIGEWRVAPSLNRIQGPGGDATLQPLSMRVLTYLAERPGQVVTYQELIDALWSDRYAGEDAVHRRIADLRRHLGDAAKKRRYIETIPKSGYRLVASVTPADRRVSRAWGAVAAVAALIMAALIVYEFTAPASAPVADDPLAALRVAVREEDYRQAFDLLNELPGRLRQSAEAQDLERAIVVPIDVDTMPPGADVRVRRYGEIDAPWQALGATPLSGKLPRGTWEIVVAADGHQTATFAFPNPGIAFNNVGDQPFRLELPATGDVPAEMIRVPAINEVVPLLGFRRFEDLGDFLIGRTEITNAEFAEFVTAGGYFRAEFWADLEASPDSMPFEEIAQHFVDSTGVPGPAFWADGSFRIGTADLPVTGVSWYEAMAYAQFRGMQLPSAPHWARAALAPFERRRPLAPALVEAANIDSSGPVPAGNGRAMSPWGSINMVGNVREWTRSFRGDLKLSLGSSFAGARWQYAMPVTRHPMNRSADQGFRLASYSPDYEITPIPGDGDPRLPELGNEDIDAIRARLAYEPGTITYEDAQLVSETDEGDWLRRKIILPTQHVGDPLPVILFLPKHASAPFQPVLFLPPGPTYLGESDSDDLRLEDNKVEFLVRNGRAVVWPVLWGTAERFRGGDFATLFEPFDQAIRARRNEIGRTLDYLASSPEFAGDQAGLLSISYGSTFVAPFILASEPRIRASAILAGTLTGWDPDRVPKIVNPNSHWQLVGSPVLFGNGIYDILSASLPTDSRLIAAVMTGPEDKRFVPYASSHWPLPRYRMERDVSEWFDAYLGPTAPVSRL